MALFIAAVIVFIIADIIIRLIAKKVQREKNTAGKRRST